MKERSPVSFNGRQLIGSSHFKRKLGRRCRWNNDPYIFESLTYSECLGIPSSRICGHRRSLYSNRLLAHADKRRLPDGRGFPCNVLQFSYGAKHYRRTNFRLEMNI
jgi:hypothetical protein